MPHKVKRIRRDRPLFLIPVALGMAGVLFSTQIEDPILQGVIVLFCLAVPLFVGGNVFAHVHSDSRQRVLLIGSLFGLTLGAILSVTGLSQRLVDFEYVPPLVGEMSHNLGIGSLFIGLLAVMYSMVRSEAMLDQVVERFRSIADHIGEGFLLVGQHGDVVLVNKAVVNTVGVREEALVGHNIWALAEGLGIQSLDYTTDAHEKGTVRQFDVAWERKGAEHHYNITVAPIFNRKRVREGDLFIIRDTTEQQRMSVRLERYTKDLHELVEDQTRAIQDSKDNLADLLMQMHEGFLTVDEHHRIVFANAIMGRLLKTDHEDLVGRELFDFLQPDQRPRLKKAFKSVRNETLRETSQEYNFVHAAGGYLPMKVAIASARGEGENRDHYSLVVTDLHDLKTMQYELEQHARQLEEANDELRELDRAKDTLLSNVSHELRTPLSTIEGYVEMFQTGSLGPLEGPQIGALNVMTRNLERLSIMIHEMLEFSRMEIKGIQLYDTVFALGKLLEESAQSALPGAMNKDIRINTTGPEDGVYMWGDRDKLSQVMGIFLSNAIKFSHEKSHIDIGYSLNVDNHIVLTITDHGIGIGEQDIDRIFQKFYQVDSSMTRHFEGTGIGLSIASRIIEAHQGSIDVQSEVNEGTTFTISLPKSSFSWSTFTMDSCSLEECSVYVVNSNEEFRGICAQMFADLGATVREFNSGYDSHRNAVSQQPDVVLLGETMPDLSGVEALNLYCTSEQTRDVSPLLMLTKSPIGNEDIEVHESQLMWKPFSPYELVQRVRSLSSKTSEETPIAQGGINE